MSTTMRAAVCVRAGGPEVLEIRELPVPAVRQGWSLVQVKGAGLNRSELRTRQGHSPNVTFPRVLGIECAGIVAASTDPTLPDGATVAGVMGDMGCVLPLPAVGEGWSLVQVKGAGLNRSELR